MKSLTTTMPLFLLLLLVGCAGGRGFIAAEGPLDGPVSLTGHVCDGRGRDLAMDRDLERVGTFEASTMLWATGAGQISLSGTWDLTEKLNRAMKEKGGEAICNLTIEESSPHAYNYLAALTLLLPSWVNVTVKGDVVRRRLGAANPLARGEQAQRP